MTVRGIDKSRTVWGIDTSRKIETVEEVEREIRQLKDDLEAKTGLIKWKIEQREELLALLKGKRATYFEDEFTIFEDWNNGAIVLRFNRGVYECDRRDLLMWYGDADKIPTWGDPHRHARLLTVGARENAHEFVKWFTTEKKG